MTAPTTDPIAGMTYPKRMHELRENSIEPLHDELETKANDRGYSPNKLPRPRVVPPASAEIFRQWQVEARLATFTKADYAGAFEDFWAALAKGECVLHGLLCEWTRLLRETNRASVREIDAARRQPPEAA